MEEAELIARCREGDSAAFEELITRYQSKIYNIALGMLGNPHDAEDAAQEIFIKAYRYIGSFHEKSSFYTWLYRISYNVCIDISRKKSHKGISVVSLFKKDKNEEETQLEIPDSAPSPDEEYIQNETSQLVRRAIGELKEDFRAVLIFRDLQGMSYEEISEILEISTGTVKSRISRAREALKKIIVEKYHYIL